MRSKAVGLCRGEDGHLTAGGARVHTDATRIVPQDGHHVIDAELTWQEKTHVGTVRGNNDASRDSLRSRQCYK